jgi:LysM repeat protein
VPADVTVRPGVPVVVPGGQARAAARGTYRVEPGETLWSIAAKFQYHPFELAALNRRYGPGIAWPGEQIIVP